MGRLKNLSWLGSKLCANENNHFDNIFNFLRYCGSNLPSNFRSSSNKVLIKFHSDSRVRGHGFLISYHAVERHCNNSLCKEGEGECNSDSECEGSLVCGHMNCINSTLQNCCTKSCNNDFDCFNQDCNTNIDQCRQDSYSMSKCSNDSPCRNGEGDCDYDGECEGSLVCSNDRCGSGPPNMDCCKGKFISSLHLSFCKGWVMGHGKLVLHFI